MNGELKLGKFAEDLSVTLTGEPGQCRESQDGHGDPRAFVYDVLSREDRRGHGVFFSGEDWATRMAALVNVDNWDRFIDPSAGIGDLLLAIAQKLPLAESPVETLASWSKTLAAVDLRASFLGIAWARIRSVAYARHGQLAFYANKSYADVSLPPSFGVNNALLVDFKLKKRDCVIMNPPYQLALAPKPSIVGSGMRTAAALHLEHIVKQAPPGVGVVALVPDVIRSGSSYRRFRESLSELLDIEQLSPAGHFGNGADVDVSILVARTKEKSVATSSPTKPTRQGGGTIGDIAQVRVGPVVPHRTPAASPRHGYLTTRNVDVNTEIRIAPEWARYDARVEQAPFIVLRRTSSPRDKRRVRASIIAGTEHWLIENHLLMVKPNRNTLAECRRIFAILCNEASNSWLNERIRCRHLTVSAIKGIPLKEV